MTRDEIIRMAAQAGFVAYGEDAGEYRIPTPAFHGRLERFGALVAAAVYENEDMFTEAYAGGFSAGAAAEREACAKRLEAVGCDHCAANIRARGEK